MNCENYFCIYQNNEKCILDEIEIDISGVCASCIYVDVEPNIISCAKQRLLKALDEE